MSGRSLPGATLSWRSRRVRPAKERSDSRRTGWPVAPTTDDRRRLWVVTSATVALAVPTEPVRAQATTTAGTSDPGGPAVLVLLPFLAVALFALLVWGLVRVAERTQSRAG